MNTQNTNTTTKFLISKTMKGKSMNNHITKLLLIALAVLSYSSIAKAENYGEGQCANNDPYCCTVTDGDSSGANTLSQFINKGFEVTSSARTCKYGIQFSTGVGTVQIDEGFTLKRIMPRARGSASRINKRTSHIHVTLDIIQDNK